MNCLFGTKATLEKMMEKHGGMTPLVEVLHQELKHLPPLKAAICCRCGKMDHPDNAWTDGKNVYCFEHGRAKLMEFIGANVPQEG